MSTAAEYELTHTKIAPSSKKNSIYSHSLTHSDFEDATFQPTKWLNQYLERHLNEGTSRTSQASLLSNNNEEAVDSKPFEALLQSTNEALQQFASVLSERIDIYSIRLTSSVTVISTELSKLLRYKEECEQKLALLRNKISVLYANQKETLRFLGEIDMLKQKMSACHKVLSDLHQWEFRINEIESLLAGGADMDIVSGTSVSISNLAQALDHIIELRDTASILATFPDFAHYSKVIPNFETRVISDIKQRLNESVVSNKDWKQWVDLYIKLRLFDALLEETHASLMQLWKDAWVKIWKQMALPEPSTVNGTIHLPIDEALLSFCELFSTLLEEKSPFFAYAIERIALNKFDMGRATVQESLNSIEAQLWDTVLYDYTTAAMGIPMEDIHSILRGLPLESDCSFDLLRRLLLTYETMANPICSTPIIAEREHHGGNLWNNVCETFDFVPTLLFEAFTKTFNERERKRIDSHPMRYSTSLAKMVLDAEADASNIFNRLSESGHDLEELSSAFVAPYWIAYCDSLLCEYFTKWFSIIDIFFEQISKSTGNTLRASKTTVMVTESVNIKMDSKHFENCLQLYSIIFNLFLELEKVAYVLCARGSKIYCKPNRFNVLQRHLSIRKPLDSMASIEAIERARNVFTEYAAHSTVSYECVFASTSSLFKELKLKCVNLVVSCCVKPVENAMKNYFKLPCWSADDANTNATANSAMNTSPTIYILSVGGHLLSLVTYSDQQEAKADWMFWLSLIVEEVNNCVIKLMLQIVKLTMLGATQLLSDLNYIIKVSETLNGNSEGLVELKNALLSIVNIGEKAEMGDVSNWIESTSFERYKHSFAKMLNVSSISY